MRLLFVGTNAFGLSDAYGRLSTWTSALIALSETLFGDNSVNLLPLAILRGAKFLMSICV